MTPERRHDEHPHPPPGQPEQRECSDKECRAAREEWVKTSLLPQLRSDFIKILIATVLTLWAAIAFTNHAQIMSHELQDVRMFVTADQHKSDMQQLRADMSGLQEDFKVTKEEILLRLDRNLTEITKLKIP